MTNTDQETWETREVGMILANDEPLYRRVQFLFENHRSRMPSGGDLESELRQALARWLEAANCEPMDWSLVDWEAVRDGFVGCFGE